MRHIRRTEQPLSAGIEINEVALTSDSQLVLTGVANSQRLGQSQCLLHAGCVIVLQGASYRMKDRTKEVMSTTERV
jgi:hypothetical protein